MIEKIKSVFGRTKVSVPVQKDERPVRFVREGDNSWRVVYAD